MKTLLRKRLDMKKTTDILQMGFIYFCNTPHSEPWLKLSK